MAAKTRNISTLIESQLPGFIVSEYENFSKFVEKYYEQLENQGQPLDIISNVTKYRDINFYEKNLLTQFTELSTSINETDDVITVEDATSFPEENGYIKIGNELCFYKERTDTQFLEVSRGVSGNTTLGDLYESSKFVTTQAEPHYTNDVVYNVSNLFLYAFVKSFESQYLGGFPEAYLKGDVDKRVLIKNISDFYKSKGTDRSIKFIFNSIVSKSAEDTPETYNPKDFTLKASTSDWVSNYSIKAKVLTGDVSKLIGTKLVQRTETSFASAVVDAVNYGGSDGIFELILSPSSINGNFKIAAQTTLRSDISVNDTTGDRIDVYSTLGWGQKGELIINSERITFIEKNVNQFIISDRTNPNTTHVAGTPVYTSDVITAIYDGGSATLLGLGVLYNLNVTKGEPYSNSGDKVQISESGFESNHPVIAGADWFLNTNFRKAFSSLNAQITAAIGDLNSDVSAIYEDDQYFYICSSGYPHHGLLKESSPVNLEDQKFLKLVRKNPITTTEVYSVSNRDVGVLIDGSLAYSNKDFETVKFGKITKINVENKGVGYQTPPFVLINNEPNKARCFLAGEVLDRIELLSDDIYEEDPTITVTSGRNAKLRPIVTNGEITSIVVEDEGEYYSSAPLIRIFDALGKGAFAEYEAIVSPEGKLVRCQKISGGRFYDRNSLIVEVIPAGSGAFASAAIREWTKDRFKKYRLELDSNNSYVFPNFNPRIGLGYGVVANPANLRFRSADNINNVLGENPGTKQHSPILGFAYDGNPIYGPYGFSDPGNPNSTVVRMNSGYQLNNSRVNGPSILQYELGTFVDDYAWVPSVNSGKTELDENNGRFCVTPEYPTGTYAYFVTIDSSGTPVFPYILGKNFYSLPVDSNYNSNISQDDLPKNLKRLRTSDIDNNGVNSFALIGDVTNGNVSGAYADSSTETFSVGSELFVDNLNTEGSGAKAFVSSVNGKNTVSLESVQDKGIVIDLIESAYLFAGDILFQGDGVLLNQIIVDNLEINDFQFSESPNVKVVNNLSVGPDGSFRVIPDLSDELTQGEIIGDVINDSRVVLRSVQNTFDPSLPVFATIKVLNLLLDKNGTYTKDSIISFIRERDGVIFGTGLVLEGTLKQNALKVRVITGDIFATDDFIIKSSTISDTSNAKIISTTSLSENLTINLLDDKVAILQTDEDHNLAIGDKVFVNIFPDDSITETTYYVRKRLYQKAILQELSFNGKIVDTGIGRFEVLNSGVDYEIGTYTDVELVFVDSSQARKNIGKPGDPGNARATIEVFNVGGGFGRVSSVTITNKGYGYKESDILTVADDDLNRLGTSTRTSRLNLFVDHVGFSAQNDELFLTSVNDLSVDDFLTVGGEVVKITQIKNQTKSVIVERAQKNTPAIDHFDNQNVSFAETSYKFEKGSRVLGDSQNSPFVIDYNSATRELLVAYEYSVNNPTRILQSSIFFDNNNPNKFVKVESVESPQFKLEFSVDQINFEINPTIDIQKYYKYKFDTSHPSMADTFLDFSSSLNYNLFTEEKNVSSNLPGTAGSFVSIKLGFGPNISSNTYQNKTPVNFNNYYYFIKASNDVNTDGSSLKVIDDPLSGEQSIIYSTDRKFVYNVKSLPQYDGSGDISYTTTSQFAIGSIANISINDTGTDYKSIPICRGVLPTASFLSTVSAKIDTTTGSLSSVVVENQGSNYSKPIAIVTDGDGFDYNLECIVENGRVKAVNILNSGKGFTYDPIVKIFESDVEVFLTSNNIGIPKNIKLINSGFGYNSDYSTLPAFKTTTTFVLKDFEDDSFFEGEKITQYENNVLIAEATVAKKGWRIGSNLLKVQNIKGIFKNNLPIKGFARSKTATLIAQINTEFTPDIRNYSDNVGRFNSERGKLSSNSQKLTDSFFYQDYSYVIKSRTSIDFWRDLIRETTHPAGFQLFGELIVESEGNMSMPSEVREIETHSFINLKPQNISIVNTRKYITENIVSFNNTNIERGIGSVSIDTFDSSETVAKELILATPFDGDFDPNSGVLYGTKTFTLLDNRTRRAYAPYNESSLIVTIDGILQEPGKSFTVKGNTITFAQPPLGERLAEGQKVEAQKFYCRSIKFKDNTLNSQYIRKIQNISDQFDGETRIFDLYEEDGSIVKSLPNEKFVVALNGVLQNARSNEEEPFENSYAIIRSQNPTTTDKIAFTDPPISHGELYDSTDDLVIREKCFIYSIGSYRRLSIDSRTVKYRGAGPFLILDEVENKVVSVDDPLYAIVFIDGVLQIPGKSYDIVGPNITFSSPLRYYEDESGKQTLQKISILLFYGRDKAKTLTFYDFEPNAYYSRANLIIKTPNSPEFYSWIPNYISSNVIISQNGNKIGKLKSFVPGSVDLNLTLLCSAFFDVDDSPFTFTSPETGNTFTVSSIESSSISFLEDEDGNRKLQVDVPSWLLGTELGRSAYSEKTKLYSNLNVGDLIQIDGESSYREIVSIPELVDTKQYNKGEFLPADIYSRIQATNYNDIVRGEGLSITADIDQNGRITKLNWNRRDLLLFFNNNVLLQPTAYQYYTPPIIDFVPRTKSGGGAKAQVISVGGQILDIVLIDGGYGYEEPPKVVVSRGYNRIKGRGRKFDTTTVLNVSPPLAFSDSLTSSSEVTLIAYGPSGQAIFSFINLAASGGIREAGEQITAIIMPKAEIVTLSKTFTHLQVFTQYAGVEINVEIETISREIVGTIDARADIISSSTISSVDRQITSIISKQINEAIVQLQRDSINDVGAYLDAPLSETDTVVYIPDTIRFPASSRLLIGKEIVYYDRKKSDRFLGVIRGADGTVAEAHNAGDYLRHLPKLVSVVPVGISAIQSVSSVELKNQDASVELVKITTSRSEESLDLNTDIEICNNIQHEVDNTEFEILSHIQVSLPVLYSTITSIHATTSEVKTISEASGLRAITTLLSTIADTDIQITDYVNIGLNVADVLLSTQIVSNAESSIESVDSAIVTLSYNKTAVLNQVGIVSDVTIESYSTNYILRNESTIDTIVTTTNTIQFIGEEVVIKPPTSYSQVISGSASSSQIIQLVDASVSSITNSTFVSIDVHPIQLTSDIRIDIDRSDILTSTQISVGYDNAYISVIPTTLITNQQEIVDVISYNVDSSVVACSTNVLYNRLETNLETITSTRNTIDAIVKEVEIKPPTSYSQVISGTYTQSKVSSFIAAQSFTNISPVISEREITCDLNIEITDTNIITVSEEVVVIPPTSFSIIGEMASSSLVQISSLNLGLDAVSSFVMTSPSESTIQLTNNLNIDIVGTKDIILSVEIGAGYSQSYVASSVATVSIVPTKITNVVSKIIDVSEITRELEFTNEVTVDVNTSDIVTSSTIEVGYGVSYVSTSKLENLGSVTQVLDVVTKIIDVEQISHSTSITTATNTLSSTSSNIVRTTFVRGIVDYFVRHILDVKYIASSSAIEVGVNPNVAQTTVTVDVTAGVRGSSSREVDYSTGILDFFTESIVLPNPISTRNLGFFTLEEPINDVTLRDSTVVTVLNANVDRDPFYIPYELGNNGNTIGAFESNAFIDTGALAVTGSIADYEFSGLTIADFELRSNSAITIANEQFNLGAPTINEIGAILTNSLTTSSTSITLTISAVNSFPESGRIIIDKEVIEYETKVGNVLSGLTRGADNTIVSAHSAGAYLRTF